MAFFNILARMMLDTSDVEAGVKRAESSVKGFAGNLGRDLKGAIAGAFTVGAIASFTRSVINAADRVGDMAELANTTVEEFQKLEVVASRTGVPVEKMVTALTKLSEIRAKAASGDSNAIGLLGSFGVSQSQAANAAVSNLQLLTQISREYQKQGDSFEVQARASELIGTKMEGVLKVMTEMDNIGPVVMFTDGDVKKLGQINDGMDELIRKVRVIAGKGMVGLMDASQSQAEIMSPVNRALESVVAGILKIGKRSGASGSWETDTTDFFEKMRATGDFTGYTTPPYDTVAMYNAARGVTRPGQFRSSSQLSLNQMGGYFFGADDTAKQDLAEMRKSLEKISSSIDAVKNQ